MVKEFKKFREIGNLKHLYRNKLGEACFAPDAAYSDCKDLANRINERVYEIAGNRKYDECQRALASMVHEFFDEKTGSGLSVNEQLAEELHKPVIKKINIRKVYGQQYLGSRFN